MKSDLKIFLKYIFSLQGFLSGIKSEIKKLFEPKRLSIILIVIAFYCLIKFPAPKGVRIFVVLIIIALMAQLRIMYITGEHKHWYRKKKGIKSKKELLREEFNEDKQGEEDITNKVQ